jgi:hypothetical protein
MADRLEPHHLAHAYFLGPMRRTGRGQVHEVDAGDHDQEYGHAREQPHVHDASPARFAVLET